MQTCPSLSESVFISHIASTTRCHSPSPILPMLLRTRLLLTRAVVLTHCDGQRWSALPPVVSGTVPALSSSHSLLFEELNGSLHSPLRRRPPPMPSRCS